MTEDARGREARSPLEMPRMGWRDILIRTVRRSNSDRIDILAASAAFWALLALFPTIAGILTMSAWVLEPGSMRDQISALSAPLPDEAAELVNDRAAEIASDDRAAGTGALIAIGFAIWTASAATKTLMEGLNAAYEERERRGFFTFNMVASALTLGTLVGFILSITAIVIVPATLALQPGLGWAGALVDWLRWPVMAVFAMLGLATLYRFGPSRRNARWRWVSIGAVVATVLWVLASLAFSLYVRHFAAYNQFYGALGGVAIMMIWFWLTAWIVLFGAELNSEIEHQTRRDSTVGPDRPMGERGAVKADTLGRIP
jgi:membrane protein